MKARRRSGEEMRILVYLIAISVITRRAGVYGRLKVNVALNRPAFMSSVYYSVAYDEYYVASRAVDGNNDSDVYKLNSSCAHTITETNPWWAVDLGTRLAVAGVLFTNRANNFGYKSDNFIVGLTDVSPETTVPTLWNYDVCGQWPGVVGDGATVYMKCRCGLPSRRYLIVQVETAYDQLNFCEIQVYIRRWDWHCQDGKKMNRMVSSFVVDNRLQCLIICTLSPVCDSYNYRPSDKTCELNTHDTPLIANSADIVSDNEWRWCRAKFTTVA